MANYFPREYEMDDINHDEDEWIDEEETSFSISHNEITSAAIDHSREQYSNIASEQEIELLQDELNDFYRKMTKDGYTPPSKRAEVKDFVKYEGEIRSKKYVNVKIQKKNGGFLALTSILKQKNGSDLIKNIFNLENVTAAKHRSNINLFRTKGTISDLEDRLAKNADPIEISTLVGETDTLVKTVYSEREYAAFDKYMQGLDGELKLNILKLKEIEKEIDDVKKKPDHAEKLKQLLEERDVRLEAIRHNKTALGSQLTNVKHTIEKMIYEDTKLSDRLKRLFKEQGITIVSVLTAIGMTISTLVVSLTGGSSSVPNPTPPKGDAVTEWIRKRLNELAKGLLWLAGKAAAALPGVIASIVSWLLKTASSAVGWLAEHVWITITAAGMALTTLIIKQVKS